MSVAAVMLVKDEADIVGYTIEHLLRNLDRVYVTDNLSTDGTIALLEELRHEHGADRLRVGIDEQVGYFQAEKTTELAAIAREDGFGWVVPCDADEFWYATDGRTIREYLGGLGPDVAQVEAFMYHHLPSSLDAPAEPCPTCGGSIGGGFVSVCPGCAGAAHEPNPIRRIRVRQRAHGSMGKVACRTRVGLEIHQGNHSAYAPGGGLKVPGGLAIRHFSWRSEAQYLRKIANGAAAYAATDLPANVGEHWRQFGNPPDLDRAAEWYRTWAYQEDPMADDSLIDDPAPWA